MRARLHVRERRAGFFREGTHEMCDVRQTRQLLPATCDVLDRLDDDLASLGLDTVSEIELSENVDASDARCLRRRADAGDAAGRERLAAIRRA